MGKLRPGDLRALLNMTVWVAALGYFVDMYDLVLFGILRVPSLKALGISGDALVSWGVFLLNMQMAGMLVGGLVWGVLGDKLGRVSVLFGSISLYSIANILNAFVATTGQYALLRFAAGAGLAGELGAAVTLVGETLPTRLRGYGTAIVASVGILGSVCAALVGDFLPWNSSYLVGGGLGIALLVMRMKVMESGMYHSMKRMEIPHGDFIWLLSSWKRFRKLLHSTLIGLPTWFVVGILITFAPEFGVRLGLTGPVTSGRAIMFTYIGLVFGDVVSGFASQWCGSRKKIVRLFLLMTVACITAYFLLRGISPGSFYALCVATGFSIGYWAVFVTIASEQFGTNMRATVATAVPNFVRGATLPITYSFELLRGKLDIVPSAVIVGVATFAIAFWALHNLEETYHKDLDYLER